MTEEKDRFTKWTRRILAIMGGCAVFGSLTFMTVVVQSDKAMSALITLGTALMGYYFGYKSGKGE